MQMFLNKIYIYFLTQLLQKAVILFEESEFASSTKFLCVYSNRCPSEIRISSCLVYKYIEELLKKGKKTLLEENRSYKDGL